MATFAKPVKWLMDFFSGMSGEDERRLNARQALGYAPVWNSVNKIANNIGVMPLELYRVTANGKEVASDDSRHYVLAKDPNEYQTPIVFKSQVTSHAILKGNGRAYIHWIGNQLQELIPLQPESTVTMLIEGKKFHINVPGENDRTRLFERVTSIGGLKEAIILADEDVIHIPGFGWDGVEGMDLLTIASRSLNSGIAGDKRYHTQVNKGFSIKGMIEAPVGMFRDEKSAKLFLDGFNEKHQGPENADRVAMLREGMKFQTYAMSNKDAEALESRRYNRQDMALWFMMESILGDGSNEVYNSIEQKNQAYLTNCLMTWITKWQEELNKKLLGRNEKLQGRYEFMFDTIALRLGDFNSTVSTLRNAVEGMLLNKNEARDILGYNRVDGGDVFENPNTTPGGQAAAPQAKRLESSAVHAHIEHLVGVEKNRLLQASDNPSKFIASVEKFYGTFEKTLQNGIAKYTVNESLASKWCDASKQRVFALTDSCTYDQIKPALEQDFAQWDERINALVQEICDAAS